MITYDNGNVNDTGLVNPPSPVQDQPQGGMPDVNPAPPVQQNPQPNQNPAPNQNQPAQPKKPEHADFFRSFLSILAGGNKRPVLDENGQPRVDANGQVITRQMTKGQLGAGILAGALASMAAGFEHLPERNGNGVMTTHLNEAAAAGGAAGAANTSQARLNKAQEAADANRARQYATMKQNLDLHSMSLAVDKQDMDQKQALVDHAAPQLEAMRNATLEDGSPIIAGENESESELQKRIRESGGDVTRDSAIPTGVRPEIGPDGQPTGRQELLWTSFHNGGKIKVTAGLKEEFPEIANVPDGTEVPVSAMTRLFLNKSSNTVVDGMINDLVDKQNELNSGDKTKKKLSLTWSDLKKENPSFGALQPKLMGLAGLDPDQFIAAAAKIDPRLGAVLQQKLGVDINAWVMKRDADKKAQDKKIEEDAKAAAKNAESNTPEGQLKIKHDQEELKKLQNENKKSENALDDKDVLSDMLLKPDNLMAMKDIGGRGQDRAAIIAEAARKAQEQGIPFDPGVINQKISFLTGYEDPKGRSSTNRQALNNILQHAADLSNTNEANRRFNMKILNTPLNKIKDEFGDKAYTDYQLTTAVLKDELSLYFAGGFAPSKEQQGTWDSILSGTATPAKTEEFAKEVAKLAFRRADTFNEQFKSVMGYGDPNLVTPAAKAAAQHLSPELAQLASKYSSGGVIGRPNTGTPGRQLTDFMIDQKTGQQIGYEKQTNQWYDVNTGQPVTGQPAK